MATLAWVPGWPEMLIIGLVALLIFGGRLPEVGRKLGQGLVEFKKGLKGVKDDLEQVDRDVKDAGDESYAHDEDPAQLDGKAADGGASNTTSSRDKAHTS